MPDHSTIDESTKTGIIGLFLAGLSALVGWLMKTVLGNKEAIIALRMEVSTLKEKLSKADILATEVTALTASVKALSVEVSKMDSERVTRECIREEIETALEKRDKTSEQRRAEWEKLHSLQVKEVVRDEVNELGAKIVREIRGTTGIQKRANRPPSGSGSTES